MKLSSKANPKQCDWAWYNDPASDISGEAIYIRDEETGRFWSPSPLPARGINPYVARHGFGYSIFEYTEAGIRTEMWTYVATDAPIKFVVLKVRNNAGAARRLSVTGCFELVLGADRSANLPHVVTEVDPKTGALFARNAYVDESKPGSISKAVSYSQKVIALAKANSRPTVRASSRQE